MLIRDLSTADAVEIRRHAIGLGSDAEPYLRDDAKGGMVVSESAKPAGASAEFDASILFTGGDFGASGGDWLFYVGLWTPQDFREEFLAWYKIEHMPILLECPIWSGCRFVERKVANGCQFYAMHQMSDKSALDSAERKFSRSTAWFARLAKNAWFDGAFTRALLRRVST